MIIQTMGQEKNKTIGKIWYPYNLSPMKFEKILYIEGNWVAVGGYDGDNTAKGMYNSYDGKNWNQSTAEKNITSILDETLSAYNIVVGTSKGFSSIGTPSTVLFGTSTGVYYGSPDHIRQSLATTSSAIVNIVNDIRFCSTSSNSYYSTSSWPDPDDWTEINKNIMVDTIQYHNGLWLAISNDYKIGFCHSTDGITWSSFTDENIKNIRDLWLHNNAWFGLNPYSTDSGGGTYRSEDGLNWKKVNDKRINIKLHEGELLLGEMTVDREPFDSDDIFWSEDNGKTWTPTNLPKNFDMTGVKYHNGIYVTAANGGDIHYSHDGKTWIHAGPEWLNTNQLYHILIIDGRWIAYGIWEGAVYSDTNGQTWKQSIGPGVNVYSMYYAEHEKLLVAATSKGIYYSE